MPKLTLSEAIAYWENYTSTQEGTETKEQIFGRLILAAAKAFACERCNGEGVYDTGSDIFDCPECVEFRKIAREGVENDNAAFDEL